MTKKDILREYVYGNRKSVAQRYSRQKIIELLKEHFEIPQDQKLSSTKRRNVLVHAQRGTTDTSNM